MQSLYQHFINFFHLAVDIQPRSTVQDVFEVAREQARQSKVNLPSHLTLTANQQVVHKSSVSISFTSRLPFTLKLSSALFLSIFVSSGGYF